MLNISPPKRDRDDLTQACVDETVTAFDAYLGHVNGNPLIYDTVSSSPCMCLVHLL